MTGTPLRKMDFISNELALAEPVPFTVAILIAKLLTLSGMSGALGNLGCVSRRFVLGMRPPDRRLLHVPGRRRTALGTQAAMHAQVLVFDHHPCRVFQRRGYVQGLSDILRRRLEPGTQFGLFTVVCDGEAVYRTDVDAGVALDAQLGLEHGLHVAVEATLHFFLDLLCR